MEIHRVSVDAINVGARMRSVKAERVNALAESISSIGLQTPLSVWTNDDGSEINLVTGAHRLAAAKKLEWDEIDCFLVNMDEIDRKLWEIAENLHRSELTAKERAEQIAEWVKLAEEKRKRQEEISAKLAEKSNGRGRPESGAAAAARELGMKERTVRRAVKIAGMSDEAKQAAEDAGLSDIQSALERIAKADDQIAEVAKIVQERDRRKLVFVEETEDYEEPDYTEAELAQWATLVNAFDASSERLKRDLILEYARFARDVLEEHGYL